MGQQRNRSRKAPRLSEAAQTFIVTGMHRSGTSLAASLLESCGVFMGSRLMPAAADNPAGFFEDLDFVEFHREALAAHGFDGDGWEAAPLTSLEPTWVARANGLLLPRQGYEQWGWKDPRTVLLLSLWAKLLPGARFVFLFRAPWDVVDSLFRRGDSAIRERPERAPSIWRRYNELVLGFMSKHPDRCLLFDSDAVAGQPLGFVQAINARFDADLALPASDLFRPDLYGRRGGGRAWRTLFSSLCLDEMELYASLQRSACRLPGRSPASGRPAPPNEQEIATAFLGEWCAARSGFPPAGEPASDKRTAGADQQEGTDQERGGLARVQLFVPDRGSHSDSLSLSRFIPADGSPQRVVFSFAYDASAALRIDLADFYCFVQLSRVILKFRRAADTGIRVWAGNEMLRLPARLVDATFLDSQSEERLEIVATSEDPQLYLEVPEEFRRPGQCRLEMTLAVREIVPPQHSSLLARLVGRISHDGVLLGQENRLLGQQLAAVRQEATAELMESRRQVLASQTENARLAGTLEESTSALAEGQRRAMASQTEISSLVRALAESQQRARANQTEISRLVRALEESTSALVESQQRVIAGEAEAARLRGGLAETTRALEETRSTLSWKLTKPLRVLPLPQIPLRRTLRAVGGRTRRWPRQLAASLVRSYRNRRARGQALIASARNWNALRKPLLQTRTPQLIALAPAMAGSGAATESKTVICVTHVFPAPTRSGVQYRISRLLRWLQATGHRVLVIVCPLPGEEGDAGAGMAASSKQLRNVIVCRRDGSIEMAIPDFAELAPALSGVEFRLDAEALGEPVTADGRAAHLLQIERTFCPDGLLSAVTKIEKVMGRCVVLAVYVWMSRLLPLLSPERTLRIIDTIDVYSTKRTKVLDFGVDEWYLTPDEERGRLARADLLVGIQDQERRELEALLPGRPVITVGVDYDVVGSQDPTLVPNVLLVASDNPMNVKGLRDFLSLCWPLARREVPNATLLVVGPVGRTVSTDVAGVHVLGAVDDLADLYSRARVVINPAVAGTGLRVKTLEALSHLRPIVTWPCGLDGVPAALQPLCLVADDWFGFYRHLVAVLTQETVAFSEPDRLLIAEHLAPEAVYASLRQKLQDFFTAEDSATA